MRMSIPEEKYIGLASKVTLSYAIAIKRFDYVVFLVKQWRIKV